MRARMSASSACAVARNAPRRPGGRLAASRSASRLLPLRTPPRTRSEQWTKLTRASRRRPVRVTAPGQVSWLSDRPTPHAFPAHDGGQWLAVGFVPDHSDAVAADLHRLPWGPLPAGRPDTSRPVTVADGGADGQPPPGISTGRGLGS